MSKNIEGIILSGLGGLYSVKADSGEVFPCRAKGAFRKAKMTPLVGDRVSIRPPEVAGEEYFMEEIFPRKNALIRPAMANLETLFVTFAPKNYGGGDTWEEKVEYFLSGYRALKAAAGDRLNILLGAEIRVDRHTGTDYLIYGLEEQTLFDLHDLIDDDLPTLSRRLREAGCLLVQAHPFRNGMKVTNPDLLDGMEVFNGNPSHDSRNSFAADWAHCYGLIPTSGSDLHHAGYPICGGIETDCEIKTNAQLLDALRSRRYKLLKTDL